MRTRLFALLLLGLTACTASPDSGTSLDETGDSEFDCATCDTGKSDGIEPGSCDAEIVVEVANTASFEELDIDAALNARAARNIVERRAIAAFDSLEEVDDVSYVGRSAMGAMLSYGELNGVDCAAAPGDNCATDPIVRTANEASLETLDDEIGLDSRAARNIVAARPFDTVAAVDAVPYVGNSALGRLQAYGEATPCDGNTPPTVDTALGIVSDLDKTVIPHATPDLSQAPFPGVVTLYKIILEGSERMTYVTARSPDRITEIPEYLEDYDLQPGPIETGTTGIPWIAQAEKVRDISSVFDAHPGRPYVLFGDTSHRDPEAYKEILALYPDRFRAGLIHMATNTVSQHRLTGLHLFHNHAEAAAILAGLGVITEADAREVYEAAISEGLVLSQGEFEQLLTDNGV